MPAAMPIGALAAQSGCSVPTIRYYERIGLLPPAPRRPGGHRLFGESELRRLTLIRRCRDFGFTIDQIKSFVSLAESTIRDCHEARDIAEAHLAAVREKLREMQALERNLSRFVRESVRACAGGPLPNCAVLERLSQPRAAEGSARRRRRA